MADKDRLRRRNDRLKEEAQRYRDALLKIRQWEAARVDDHLHELAKLVGDALSGPSAL